MQATSRVFTRSEVSWIGSDVKLLVVRKGGIVDNGRKYREEKSPKRLVKPKGFVVERWQLPFRKRPRALNLVASDIPKL